MILVNDWIRTARRVPYVGFDYVMGIESSLPADAFRIIRPFQEEPQQPTAPTILMLGMDADSWASDPLVESRCSAAKSWAFDRGIQPVGIMIEEEWLSRPDVRAWPTFAGMSDAAFYTVMLARLGELYAIASRWWPDAYTINVESTWHTREGQIMPATIDVVGVDPYLPYSTSPVSDQATFDLFQVGVVGEVEAIVAHTPRPILLVAQAFHQVEGGVERPCPSEAQLEWWYVLAQRTPQIAALEFFAANPAVADPNVRGILQVPAFIPRVLDILAHRASLPG